MRHEAWWLVACLGVGSGALVFAALPGPWPNPLPQGTWEAAAPQVFRPVFGTLAAMADACARGDVDRFAAVVTPTHQASLQKSLAPLGGGLDAELLRALGPVRSAWVEATAVAGCANEDRVAVALAPAEGGEPAVLRFRWDGERLRFDGAWRDAVGGGRSAKAAVVEACRR